MPLLQTFGSDSSYAYGFNHIALSGTNFISYSGFSSYSYQNSFTSIAIDTSNNLVIVTGGANPSSSNEYGSFYVFTNAGVLNSQTYYADSAYSLYANYPGTIIKNGSNYVVLDQYFGSTSQENAGLIVYNSSGVFQSGKYAGPPAGTSQDFIDPRAIIQDGSGNFIVGGGYEQYNGGCCPFFYGYPYFTVFNSSYSVTSQYYITNAPQNSYPTTLAIKGNLYGFAPANNILFTVTNTSTGAGNFRSYSGTSISPYIQWTLADSNYIYGTGRDSTYADYAIATQFNSSYSVQWTTYVLISNSFPQQNSSVLDSSSNIYSVYYDPRTGATASVTATIVKINSSGTLQWVRNLDFTAFTGATNLYISISDIKVDNVGNYYICGKIYYYLSGHFYYKALLCSFPTDGSKTGTYVDGSATFKYSSISATQVSKTLSFGSSTNNSITTVSRNGSISANSLSATATNNVVNF